MTLHNRTLLDGEQPILEGVHHLVRGELLVLLELVEDVVRSLLVQLLLLFL